MDNFKRRRLNTEILNKTQIALEAIKRYDMMEQSRINFQVNQGSNSGKLISDLDYHYSQLTPHKPLKLDHKFKLHLFPHSEEFFCLPMRNYIFPMKVLLRNVKNQATLYVGYDRQYPGIAAQSKKLPFDNPSQKEKNYDSRTQVSRDLLIILKNKGNKQISNLYFTIVAGRQLFICDLSIQFLGLPREEANFTISLCDRNFSETKLQPSKVDSPAGKSVPLNRSGRTKTSPSNSLNKGPKEFSRSKVTLDKIDMPVRVEEFSLLGQVGMAKHQSRSQESLAATRQKFSNRLNSREFNPTATVRNDSFGMKTLRQKSKKDKSDLDFRIGEVKRNKELQEEYKIKEKELRDTASRCKRMIEDYKRIFNEESIRRKKLNKDMVILLYYSKFVKRVFESHRQRMDNLTHKVRTDFLCHRFARRLGQAYAHTCSLVPQRKARYVSEGHSGIHFLAKLIHKQSNIRAEQVVKETLDHLYPLLVVRHSMIETQNYRKSVRLIQRVWKTKYHGRMYCLLYFVDSHVEKMLREYPHFKVFFDSFYASGANRRVCLDYIKDESQKFRFIHEAYKRKLEEIEQIIKFNLEASKKSAPKGMELRIPERPVRPMHRFYRNSDILKSMVRTWFEIEYKKYQRKALKKKF